MNTAFRILARARHSASALPLPLPPPTPAAIAAEIARPPAHVEAEKRLAELRARREAIKAEAEAIVLLRDAAGNHPPRIGGSLAALQRDRLAVEAEINAAAKAIAPTRQERGRRVAEALALRCASAAGHGLAALAALHESAAELNAIAQCVNRAAHTGEFHPARHLSVSLPPLGAVEAALRRLVKVAAQ